MQRWEKYITVTVGTMAAASRVLEERNQSRLDIWTATSRQDIYYIYLYKDIYLNIKKSTTVGGPAKCRIFPPRPHIRHLFISLPFHFEGRSFLFLKTTFLFVRY